MEYNRPVCDICLSVDFDTICTDEITPRDVIASKYFHPEPITEGTIAIMRYSHYKAICKGCGKEYKFTR